MDLRQWQRLTGHPQVKLMGRPQVNPKGDVSPRGHLQDRA